jgi:hypothetical protein
MQALDASISTRRGGLLRIWAILGVSLLLIQSLVRLAPIAWEPIAQGQLGPGYMVIYVAWALLNSYLEGYRGFHQKFVPRVLRRTLLLEREPSPVRVIFAPFFVMGYFGSEPAERRAAIGVTAAVLVAIFVVRGLAQPWRGLIDGGVVAGLGFGLLSLWYRAGLELFSQKTPA